MYNLYMPYYYASGYSFKIENEIDSKTLVSLYKYYFYDNKTSIRFIF